MLQKKRLEVIRELNLGLARLLSFAIRTKDEEMVREILKKDKKLLRGELGWLCTAVISGFVDLVEIMVKEFGGNINERPSPLLLSKNRECDIRV